MAPFAKILQAARFFRRSDEPCPIDSHMTENGCSGFEETWPYSEETYPDGISTETTPTWEQPEPIDPNAWTGTAEPIKVESDYKLAGVPVFAWIMLITAIVAVFCAGFYYFARYLWRQDQAIKAAKAAADEEAAAASEPEPEAKPKSPELLKQVEADLEALKATPSLPALWYAYGNITARIDQHPKLTTFEDVVRSIRQP